MVINVINFLCFGFYDWMVQCVFVVVFVVYVIFLLGYFIVYFNIFYVDWYGLFLQGWMCIFSLLILVVLSVYVWVGMWIIFIDYLILMVFGKVVIVVCFFFQVVCGMVMFVFFVWGVQIFWGM